MNAWVAFGVLVHPNSVQWGLGQDSGVNSRYFEKPYLYRHSVQSYAYNFVATV